MVDLLLPNIRERLRPKFSEIYGILRSEVRRKITNRLHRISIFSFIDVAEEHDSYTLTLPLSKLISVIEEIGTEAYLEIVGKSSLLLALLFVAMGKRPQSIKDLSVIAKNYADQLEPFVATLQVILEPELAPLRRRTPEQEMEKAKELPESLLEHVESKARPSF